MIDINKFWFKDISLQLKPFLFSYSASNLIFNLRVLTILIGIRYFLEQI